MFHSSRRFRPVCLLLLAVLALGLTASCSKKPAPDPKTYAALLDKVFSPDALARLDGPSATLVSSADPANNNADYLHFIRDWDDEWAVVADLKGPGYVSRLWLTGSNGEWPLRFYFDGAKKPQIELPLRDLFAPLGNLSGYEPWCWVSLIPIPYREGLVITMKKPPNGNPRMFHHVNWCPLPAGTPIPGWGNDLVSTYSNVLAAADAKLTGEPAPTMGPETALTTIAPGAAADLLTMDGPGIFRELAFRLDAGEAATDSQAEAAIRGAILRIYWDGAAQPSVEVPFGDFFGSVWTPRQFQSRYFGMSNGVYFTRFPMPFAKKARIEILNMTASPVRAAAVAKLEKLAAWDAGWGYFHSAWQKSGPDRVGIPHPMLAIQGRGRYVGCILSATSHDRSYWLLEANENIRIDDDFIPRWRGTGLEDYFNSGWYYGSSRVKPYHGMLMKAQFRTIQYRIHQTDPVTFEKQAFMTMERGPQQASHGTFESVVFFYMAQPTASGSRIEPQQLAVPDDGLLPATIMLELNELEHLGDYAGARRRLGAFLERYPTHPYRDVLEMRKLMYEPVLSGGKTDVSAQLAAIAAQSTNALAKSQASALAWFNSASNNAILGGYSDTRARIFLDGQPVLEAADPERMLFTGLEVKPGRHALAIEFPDRQYPPWIQVCLRTHAGDIISSPGWRFSSAPEVDGWKLVGFNDASWATLKDPDKGKGPPEEPYFFLEPNIFVGMQARARGFWPTDAAWWPDNTKPGRFRHEFTIP